MGKKLPILISTLAITATNIVLQSSSVSAASFLTPTGETAWTFEEVKATAKSIAEEIGAECPDDINCQSTIMRGHLNEGGIYKAVRTFYSTPLIFTTITPNANKLSLYFQIKRTAYGNLTNPEDTLTDIDIAWSDAGHKGVLSTYGGMIPKELPDWAHLIYRASQSTHGAGWIPSNTEYEIFAPDSNLEANTKGILEYTTYSVRSSLVATATYASCIQSEYYEPGMECRVAFAGTGGQITYVPFKDGRPAYPDSGYVEPVAPEPEQPTITDTPTDTTTEPLDESSQATIANDSKSSEIPPVSAANKPKSPETGTNTYPAEVCKREISMPWWLVALILVGNTLLIWWFAPNRHHSRQNPQKSPKKL